MKLKFIYKVIFLLSYLFYCSFLEARVLNLKEALKKSLQLSQASKLQEIQIEEALIKKSQISQNWQPVLSASLSQADNLTEKKDFLSQIELQQKTPFGLSLRLSHEEKAKEVNAAQDALVDSENRLSLDISQTVWPLPHKQDPWLKWQGLSIQLVQDSLALNLKNKIFFVV